MGYWYYYFFIDVSADYGSLVSNLFK